MDLMNIVLSVIAFLILGIGVLYTYRIGQNQKYSKKQYDTQINEKVQAHAYIRNPVFLTYIIMFVLTLAFILYWALRISW